MYGHANKYLLEAEISPAQRVNCRAGKLATAALMAAVEANEFISSIFLLEKVCVEITGEWVTGSPKNAITELWGEQVVQVLYDSWGVVSKENPFVCVCVCVFLASSYEWVTVMHEIPISSAQTMTSFHTLELSSTIPLVPPERGLYHRRRFQRVQNIWEGSMAAAGG